MLFPGIIIVRVICIFDRQNKSFEHILYIVLCLQVYSIFALCMITSTFFLMKVAENM